ncbi:DEAD/DEAH box helicase [Magnetococcus sp. PR-3]|uniref:DEAD/DEAH box helicase n=1 Tax=Magnetococcus sp. PR-3 TaxID=3120355 RepID=UPI003FA5C5F6
MAPTIPSADRGGVHELIARLRKGYGQRITGEVQVPAKEAVYAPFPEALDGEIVRALQGRGVEQLYSHQRASWDAVAAGEHVVVVTPTASGKTLCYNLPVLQAARQKKSKALYLFPTKALAQDQLAELHELNRQQALGVKVFTFDGDTPADARKAVRTKGDIVISNPDMLHQGVLPHHTKWAQFFENLAYIVIDETHTYRGVFGSHMANVLRRLKRICAFYRVKPQFILCSATIANPKALAERLLEEPVTAITESGAPAGEKTIMLWNPPVVNEDLGIRASARSQSTQLAHMAVDHGVKSIVFTRTRLMVEVITKYLKDIFDKDPRRPERIAAYRGGYLPTERRSVERKLREGDVNCVVATSALELGVDIGDLDCCVLNGYPGSIAATWQRLGRAGRRNQAALGVLVGASDALDQFIVRHPDFFAEASPEQARIAPDQLLILLDHVRCAAFELPFKDGEVFGGEALVELLGYLQEEGVLHHEGNQWHWNDDSYPANAVSLRSVSDGNFVVIDITDGGQRVVAEVDYSAAPMTLYENAIYMIQATPYQVERLDWDGRKAFVKKTKADYYTDAIDYTKLKILDQFEGEQGQAAEKGHGEVHLVRRVAGFKKIRYYTHENVGFGHIHLPDSEMHTTSLWWRIQANALEQAFQDRWQALSGFLGASYALHTVAAVRIMAERGDLGRAVGDGQAGWSATQDPNRRGALRDADGQPLKPENLTGNFEPTLFLYDSYPGGIGFTEPLYGLAEQIVQDALALVQRCDCKQGCPSCVGAVLAAEEEGGASPRSAALTVLRLLSA